MHDFIGRERVQVQDRQAENTLTFQAAMEEGTGVLGVEALDTAISSPVGEKMDWKGSF